MANNYTQFSVLLPKVPEEKLAAFMEAVEARQEAAEEEDDYESMPLRGMEYETRDGELWLHADDSGDVDAAAKLIQDFLAHFDIDGGIYMSWACTCSKPRINQFEGGAVVVTHKDMLWLSAYDVLKKASEAGVEVLNEWE